MLYDFYTNQNTRKANSVHATYLLVGWQKCPQLSICDTDVNDEDVQMLSSPYVGSSAPDVGDAGCSQTQRVITLVRQDHVEC